MWSCPWSKKVWKFSFLNGVYKQWREPSFIDLLAHVVKTSSNEEVELFSVICWLLWKSRNRFKHEGVVEESKHIVWSANEWLNTFQDAQRSNETVTNDATQKRVQVKWRPPTAPNLKLNTDAAIDYKKKKAGLGMVVRDGEGKLKCAGHKVLPGNPSIVAIEALAVYHGLLLCREAGFQKLVVESDSTIVIDALNKTELDLSVEGGVLDDIKCLASTFKSVLWKKVNREGNIAAHKMAKHALIADKDRLWQEAGPPWLTDIILDECRN
ncbi:uncharacterized protein LOC133737053 [Rosa rugosa]|uniref:uncharacterized protein LOC133737053 n=1 Tax=Rosa rugosa TaxID=74645 RepID=UPI002B40C735|nr:uncharacterized protein LOC133737053 [Rosa rugosa]